MISRRHRGDTVVELVLAFAIFSLAAITTIMILNKGVAISQRSLETVSYTHLDVYKRQQY